MLNDTAAPLLFHFSRIWSDLGIFMLTHGILQAIYLQTDLDKSVRPRTSSQVLHLQALALVICRGRGRANSMNTNRSVWLSLLQSLLDSLLS